LEPQQQRREIYWKQTGRVTVVLMILWFVVIGFALCNLVENVFYFLIFFFVFVSAHILNKHLFTNYFKYFCLQIDFIIKFD
jgi:hypothetical protein